MDPFIKEQWCAALESGTYTQGTGSLRHAEKYCCLGVLCEILHIPHTINKSESVNFYDYDTTYAGEISTLPQIAIDLSGLSSSNPSISIESDRYFGNTLASLNDEGMPFNNLAQLIRAQL